MKVTAIIPSLYEVDGEYMKLCVESLRKTVDWNIVVVTNGTKTKPYLGDIQGLSTHIHTRDQGQCNAVNIGAQLAPPDTDYLFISNSDMYYAPGWNENLKFDYSVFSPNLVEPTNNPGSAAPFLKCDGGFTLDEFKKSMVDFYIETQGIAYLERRDHSVTTGFNLPFFIRKDVWATIGGYDTAYDPWGSGSDTDLQMKVELAGIKPMRLKDVLVYHFSNKSGTFDGTHQTEWQNNWNYLEAKWGFNRDEAGSDTWMAKDMIMWDKLKYSPEWRGKYES